MTVWGHMRDVLVMAEQKWKGSLHSDPLLDTKDLYCYWSHVVTALFVTIAEVTEDKTQISHKQFLKNNENSYLDAGPLLFKSCERLVKDIEQMAEHK